MHVFSGSLNWLYFSYYQFSGTSYSPPCVYFLSLKKKLYLLETLVVISMMFYCSVEEYMLLFSSFKFVSFYHKVCIYSLFSLYFQVCSQYIVIFVTGPSALFCCLCLFTLLFPHIKLVYSVFNLSNNFILWVSLCINISIQVNVFCFLVHVELSFPTLIDILNVVVFS